MEVQLTEKEKAEYLYQSFSPKKLNLIIFTTEKCNFRCTYCYEDFKIGAMKEDVYKGISKLIESRAPGLSVLQIDFFGGEPLLTPSIIEHICSVALEQCKQRPQLEYQASATTNGALLTRERFETYSALGLREYQISIDGDQDAHDKTRLRANGKGTFGQIWDNLRAIKESDAPGKIMLRVHLVPDNVDSVLRLIDRVRQDLDDPRFELFFKAVGYLGGDNDGKFEIFRAGSPTFRAAMDRIQSKLDERSDRFLVREDPYKATVPICYASEGNSLAIRADGRVAKCTVALDDPRNNIGRIRPDGTLDIAREKLAPWLRGFNDFDTATLKCPMGTMPAVEELNKRFGVTALE